MVEGENSTSIEKQGSAQALSEIMCGLGFQYFEHRLQLIFAKLADKRAFVKEGYLSVFVFLPSVLNEKF
jgi:hypothetical protein